MPFRSVFVCRQNVSSKTVIGKKQSPPHEGGAEQMRGGGSEPNRANSPRPGSRRATPLGRGAKEAP